MQSWRASKCRNIGYRTTHRTITMPRQPRRRVNYCQSPPPRRPKNTPKVFSGTVPRKVLRKGPFGGACRVATQDTGSRRPPAAATLSSRWVLGKKIVTTRPHSLHTEDTTENRHRRDEKKIKKCQPPKKHQTKESHIIYFTVNG